MHVFTRKRTWRRWLKLKDKDTKCEDKKVHGSYFRAQEGLLKIRLYKQSKGGEWTKRKAFHTEFLLRGHIKASLPHTSAITVFVELSLETEKRVAFGAMCSSDPVSQSRCVLMTFLQWFTPHNSIGRERYCKPRGACCSIPPLLCPWFTTHFMHMPGISPSTETQSQRFPL